VCGGQVLDFPFEKIVYVMTDFTENNFKFWEVSTQTVANWRRACGIAPARPRVHLVVGDVPWEGLLLVMLTPRSREGVLKTSVRAGSPWPEALHREWPSGLGDLRRGERQGHPPRSLQEGEIPASVHIGQQNDAHRPASVIGIEVAER
jgi:hypothetical protein